MAPLVASLLSSGLSLLGNAVLEKGKDYVEKKLGIELPDESTPASAEKLAELRQAEFDHEEALLAMAIRRAEISLEEYKASLADTDSARKRETQIATAEHAPLINKVISPVLALLIVVGGGVLLFVGDTDVRVAAASLMGAVLQYYFGSSLGSKSKQEMIDRMAK